MADINFKIPCWYTCRKEPGEEDIDCRLTCHRYMHMNYFIMNCGMPNAERYLKPINVPTEDEDAYDRLIEIKDNVNSFVKNGNNLLLTSDKTQNGKTTWCLKLMYRYFHEIWAGSDYVPKGYFLYVPDFLRKLKSFEYNNTSEYKEIDKNLKNVDIVIWDDIINYPLSITEQTILNNYIVKRMMEGKANIFNGLDLGNIKANIGEVLYMRLSKCEKIELKANLI